ncbi:MAG: hypothetical protein HYZ27_06195, partial [Deltaproteobacteria bacterium]|nr:hypothetical protein [Deltaproteobacteria bacterium]
AFQICDLFDAMRSDSGASLKALRVDGGAAANDLLMQFQADILGVDIHRPAVLDTTALGTACLAALGVGLFSDIQEVAKAWRLDKVFKPDMPADRVSEQLARWRQAVAKA